MLLTIAIFSLIEQAGRTCYKSENKITSDSAEKFIRNLLKRGHEAVIEHGSVTLRITCDRGVSHEIVRHRLAAYCQESTRYCNYSKDGFGGEITVIKPSWCSEGDPGWDIWKDACHCAEEAYFDLLTFGQSPQEARSVLPQFPQDRGCYDGQHEGVETFPASALRSCRPPGYACSRKDGL